MLCSACGRGSSGSLCRDCRRTIAPAGDRWIGTVSGGVTVQSAFVHAGAARRLVHELKYRSSRRAARILAEAMAGSVPSGARCLVPVPRTVLRTLVYGVDPGTVLAGLVGELTGLPVCSSLGAPLWSGRHAGRARAVRAPVAFRLLGVPPDPRSAVLVDDVVTTGATLLSAARRLGGTAGGLTATSAVDVTSLH